MTINALQQAGFLASPNFNAQVDSVVSREASKKNEDWSAKLDAQTRERLASVVRNPANFGFTRAIITSAGWGVTYDAWSNDPNGSEGAILAAVNNMWLMLTGIVEPPTP